MRLLTLVSLLVLSVPTAEARRVKTPKSENARAEAKSHKAHGEHVPKKIKTKRSKRRD